MHVRGELKWSEIPSPLQIGVQSDTAGEEEAHQQCKQNHLHDTHSAIVNRERSVSKVLGRALTGQNWSGLDGSGLLCRKSVQGKAEKHSHHGADDRKRRDVDPCACQQEHGEEP